MQWIPGIRVGVVVLTVASLCACGGGGDGDGDGSSGGGGGPGTGTTGPTQGVDGLTGEWTQSLCVLAGGKGSRQFIQVSKTGDNSLSFSRGVFQYATTDCSGTGTPFGAPTSMGDVSFTRSEATATLAANWGLWTYPSGQAHTIWAKKGETTVCLIGDSNPSALPTAAQVEGYADLSIQAGGCYVK